LILAHQDDVVVLRIHRLPVGRHNGGLDGFYRWLKASVEIKKEICACNDVEKTFFAKPEYQRWDDDTDSFMG
jgi:hypothetical protein